MLQEVVKQLTKSLLYSEMGWTSPFLNLACSEILNELVMQLMKIVDEVWREPAVPTPYSLLKIHKEDYA